MGSGVLADPSLDVRGHVGVPVRRARLAGASSTRRRGSARAGTGTPRPPRGGSSARGERGRVARARRAPRPRRCSSATAATTLRQNASPDDRRREEHRAQVRRQRVEARRDRSRHGDRKAVPGGAVRERGRELLDEERVPLRRRATSRSTTRRSPTRRRRAPWPAPASRRRSADRGRCSCARAGGRPTAARRGARAA